ncbi:MAG TPA: DUF3410 domain-containing protein, partial [Bacteroidota bacterium]|nr:DUF3410 domain-containing protein [Bacteroidota bacterium]
LARVSLGSPHIAGYSLDGKVNAAAMIRAALCRFLGNDRAWDPAPGMPPPPVPDVALPSAGSGEEILAGAVRACYDIEYDDLLLRAIADVPAEDRGRFFMRLRTGYRLRREFSSVRLNPSPDAAPCRRLLEDVGFRL